MKNGVGLIVFLGTILAAAMFFMAGITTGQENVKNTYFNYYCKHMERPGESVEIEYKPGEIIQCKFTKIEVRTSH